MKNHSPDPQRQKAITPKFLKYLLHFSSPEIRNIKADHAADLLGGGFFFAMRSCEFTKPSRAGKTKPIRLGGIRFFDKGNVEVPHEDPDLLRKSQWVRILFEDQKNGERFDSRTQQRSGLLQLCPVICLARAVKRVLKFVPNCTKNTLLAAINCRSSRSKFITNRFTRSHLRAQCKQGGGEATFGFGPADIGNKSIRSGAAMSLFLNDTPVPKIMILGRWKSRAFLDYIRPQIIQWTANLAPDMVSFNNFFELCERGTTNQPDDEQNSRERHYNLPMFNTSF